MKTTARQARYHVSNTIHHVMMRGNNRQKIFFNEEHYQYFLNILEESVKKFDHEILAYCLMSNHIHLIVHIVESSLSTIMRYINFRYAFWVNRKNDRIGHLFQGRYRSIEVADETYLVNLCRYIHFNPVVASMVESVHHYPWSSHQYYVNQDPVAWVKTNMILEAIQRKTNLNYTNFINCEVEREKWQPALYLGDNGEIVLNKDLVKDLYKAPKNTVEEIKSSQFIDKEVVTQVVCRNLLIGLHQVCGLSRGRAISRKRTLVVRYLLNYTELTMVEIAKLFRRTPGTLSRQLTKLEKNLEASFPSALLEKINIELEKFA